MSKAVKKKKKRKRKGSAKPKRRPIKINTIKRAAERTRELYNAFEINRCVVLFENKKGELLVAFSKWKTVEKFIETNRSFHKMTFYQNLLDFNLEDGLNLQRRLIKAFGEEEGRDLFLTIHEKADNWKKG